MKRLGFMLGRPLAPLYSLAMVVRAQGYQRGYFATHTLPVPVISVGNLLMGGTGKTPLVQHLARLLHSSGKKPAIISRGYGGKAKGLVNVVSDGDTLFLDAAQAGDEPRFLAESLPSIPVLTGVARHLPASEAVAMGADVLLLDDGFQHLAVQRDINLVLFNADRLAGNSRVFPGGELREPVSALKRATAFVLTDVNSNNRQRAELFTELLVRKFPERPVYLAGYVADTALMLNQDGTCTHIPLDMFCRQQPDCLFAFCGIAGPDSFFRTLTDLSLTPTATFTLQDHHAYNLKQMQLICSKAQASGAQALITTEKDLVKIGDLAAHLPLPVYALRMRVEMDEEFGMSLLQKINT